MSKPTKVPINNLVVFGDTHFGCRMALSPLVVNLDDGGTYNASPIQKKLLSWWDFFWGEWVPTATKGEPFAVLHMGDSIDGSHHNSTTQISQNIEDQVEAAYQMLWPIVQMCDGRFYMLRGTEAHVGKSAVYEEMLAKRLEAKRNKQGQSTSYIWNLQVGKANCMFTHHISSSSSMAYETSALTRQMQNTLANCARWRKAPPDIFGWAHRHSHVEVRFASQNRYCIGFVTAAWQLRTPFAYRLASGTTQLPQIGGSLIRQGDREAFTEHFTKDMDPPEVEVL